MSKKAPQKPIRITMTTERYEVAGSVFTVASEFERTTGLTLTTPDEELIMGILSDDLSDNPSDVPASPDDYFVKPADPAVLRAMRDHTETDAIEKMKLITEGTLATMPDPNGTAETVVISYHETELSGMEGTTSTITYRTDDPGLVTMLRSGTVRTALTFRAHHRTVCTYDTPYMPFQIAIHALVVDNRLSTDGELVLDYLIEIKGGVAERCTMRITIGETKS